MDSKYARPLARGVAALVLVTGLATVSACVADQTAEQTEGLRTSEEAVKPFAPEVAEDAAADYAPDIDPSNFVKKVDNPTFRSNLARRWSTRARLKRVPSVWRSPFSRRPSASWGSSA